VDLKAILSVALLVAYGWIANTLAFRAYPYRVDPDAPWWGWQIWYSKYFTEPGQRLRRTAIRFTVIGGIAALVVWWLIWSL
jgi:hypothetical protein